MGEKRLQDWRLLADIRPLTSAVMAFAASDPLEARLWMPLDTFLGSLSVFLRHPCLPCRIHASMNNWKWYLSRLNSVGRRGAEENLEGHFGAI